MNKRKLIVAVITAVLIFTVGTLLALGGSLLAFSTIYRGFYFNNSLYKKVSLIIGLVVTFFVNIFAKFDGIWTIFVGIAIIITFDCILIFIKEAYDSLMAKKKAKKSQMVNS